MSSIALYLREKSGIKEAPWILAIPIIVFLALCGVYQIRAEKYVFLAGAGLVFVFTYGWKTETWAGLILTYLGMSTSYNYGADYELTLVPYYMQAGIAFTIFLIFLNYVNSMVTSRSLPNLKSDYKANADIVGLVIGIMMVYLLFQLLMGFVRGHDPYFILTQVCYMVFYLAYYIWRNIIKSNESVFKWLRFFVSIGVLAGISYIYLASTFWSNPVELIMNRAITRQAHFGLTAIPFSIGFFIIAKNRWQKTFYLFATIILYLFILVSQIRALWLTSAALTFMMFVLYAFRNGNNKKAWIIVLSGILAVTIFFLAVLISIIISFDLDTDLIFRRWGDVSSGKDISLAMRIADASNYWEWIRMSPILGHGLGKAVFSVPLGKQFMLMDNSYVCILLIGGFALGIMLVALYVISLYRSIKVYFFARTVETRIIAAATFAAISGTMIAALTCANLLAYRFVYLYAMLMAIAFRLWRTYSDNKRALVDER